MRRHFFGGDKVLWTIVAMLVVISLLVIYSASYYRTGGDKMGLRDVVIIGIGLVAMIAVYLMPYRWYSIFAHPVFWIALGVTLLTSGRNNSWIPGFNFAPFEVLKVGLVMVLARELGSNMRQRILPLARTWNENKKILMTRTIWIFLPIILTILVTWKIGTSTTILVGITAALMFYMGLVKWSDIFALVGAGLVAVLIAMAFGLGRGDTAGSRFEQWRPDMFSEHTKTSSPAIRSISFSWSARPGISSSTHRKPVSGVKITSKTRASRWFPSPSRIGKRVPRAKTDSGKSRSSTGRATVRPYCSTTESRPTTVISGVLRNIPVPNSKNIRSSTRCRFKRSGRLLRRRVRPTRSRCSSVMHCRRSGNASVRRDNAVKQESNRDPRRGVLRFSTGFNVS